MPLSNQGGGPWGSGPKGPWGSGPQSSGPTPPDLEDWLRRGQDKLRTVLPGGGGGLGSKGFGIIAAFAVVLWGLSGIFVVEPDELGVVLRFGQYVRQVPPGLNYHLPAPIETVLTPKALRVNQIDIGIRNIGSGDVRRGTTVRDVPEDSLMLTGDENIVDAQAIVQYRIKDAGEYLFRVADPDQALRDATEVGLRSVIGRTTIEEVLTVGRVEIQNQTREFLQQLLDTYQAGLIVTEVKLQVVDPP